MLVLSCKPGGVLLAPQSELAVTVVSVERDGFRQGVSTPDEVNVDREQGWQEIGKADRPSATPDSE